MYRKISSGIWRPFKAGEDKLIIQSCDQYYTLRWRHNDHTGVSNHQPHGCLLNRLFRRKSKKTSKLRVTGLCAGNSPGTGEFPAQMASYAENVSIWWRHHDICSEVVNDQPVLINRVILTHSPRPRQFATISIDIFKLVFLLEYNFSLIRISLQFVAIQAANVFQLKIIQINKLNWYRLP